MPYLKCPLHTVLKLTPVAYGEWGLSAKHAKKFDSYLLLNLGRRVGLWGGALCSILCLLGLLMASLVSLCSLLQAAGWSPSH